MLGQTKEFAAPDVEGQAEQVMLNLGAILDAAGSSFGQVRGPLASPPITQGQPNVYKHVLAKAPSSEQHAGQCCYTVL